MNRAKIASQASADKMAGEVDRLCAAGLSVGYDGHALVEDIELHVRPGEILTFIGPNGAGKSTILKTLSGYLDPMGGTVFVKGEPLDSLSPKELSLQMSVMLTERLKTELMTCADVVESGRYPYTGRLGVLQDEDRRVVREAMELVNIWDLREHDFMRVSDGQKQRVMLARAIAQDPSIIVLDEPTTYLDIRYQIELLDVLVHLARMRGIAIVMSLHELSLARIVSDWVICVKGSRLFAQGTPEQIFTPAVIDELYDLPEGVYDPQTGAVSLSRSARSRIPHTCRALPAGPKRLEW